MGSAPRSNGATSSVFHQTGANQWTGGFKQRRLRPTDRSRQGGCAARASACEWRAKPMLAGPNGDNPLILGPAGTLHMSVLDFAKWAAWHAGNGRRPPALVSPDTVKKLHTPVIDTGVRENAPRALQRREVALGWGEVNLDWSSGPSVNSYRIERDESRNRNDLAGSGFRFRDDDEYRRSGGR